MGSSAAVKLTAEVISLQKGMREKEEENKWLQDDLMSIQSALTTTRNELAEKRFVKGKKGKEERV
jgi:hypothetical protein